MPLPLQLLCMLLHKRWQILHMSKHSELRDLRSEDIHFKNKYKFMILKSTVMPQIKEAFVGYQRKYKIYITMSIWVLFWYLIYRHNIFKKPATFICTWFINFRFKVFVLAALIIGDKLLSVYPDISKTFPFHKWTQLFIQICATNYQTYLENQLNNFWTWNNSVVMKYHISDSAEWLRIIWAQFGNQCFGTPRLTALKLFPEKVFSSDHNSNLKWTILRT
jgi:hypothetical protein